MAMPLHLYFKEFGVIGKVGQTFSFDLVKGVGKGHIPKREVVTIGFAISGHMDELGAFLPIGESLHKAAHEFLSAPQEPLKGDGAGNRAVVKSRSHIPSGLLPNRYSKRRR